MKSTITTESDTGFDTRVRLAAFDWLANQTKLRGDILSREVLARGFQFEGSQVPLISPQGIFKPKILAEIPLTITTSPDSPYKDSFDARGFLLYKYRGTDPFHPDNVGLRKGMQAGAPMVYFYGLAPGKYLAVWPVYIVGDDPVNTTFRVAADDPVFISHFTTSSEQPLTGDDVEPRRAYITSTVRRRLHQQAFRERVLRAYREQCACCGLRHAELLDAAHIIPDSKPTGEPIVRNGIALCKLHHAAFDAHFFAIRPNYIMEVRNDILHEKDGPTLIHGLQQLNNSAIILPHPKGLSPDPLLLEQRYNEFRAAS